MFLMIPDSVMNSHMKWVEVFMQLKLSVADSRQWNKVLDELKMLLNCRIYDAVINSFSFILTTVWSRCFWSSQTLWWILTSSQETFSCKLNSLLQSHVDWRNVLDNEKMPLSSQIYFSVLNSLFLWFNKCMK